MSKDAKNMRNKQNTQNKRQAQYAKHAFKTLFSCTKFTHGALRLFMNGLDVSSSVSDRCPQWHQAPGGASGAGLVWAAPPAAPAAPGADGPQAVQGRSPP